jgi:hypothetical protein
VEHEVTTRVPADTKKPAEITDDLVKVTATNELVVNEVTISEPERQVTANEPAPTKAALLPRDKPENCLCDLSCTATSLPLQVCCGGSRPDLGGRVVQHLCNTTPHWSRGRSYPQ